jgi:hypothetical protein
MSSRKGIGVYTPTASPRVLCILYRHTVLVFFNLRGSSSHHLEMLAEHALVFRLDQESLNHDY